MLLVVLSVSYLSHRYLSSYMGISMSSGKSFITYRTVMVLGQTAGGATSSAVNSNNVVKSQSQDM